MKDELQGKLVEILTSIQGAAGRAGDFAMEQLPDIAQSYVAYGRVYYTLAVLGFALAALATVRWVMLPATRSNDDFVQVGVTMVGGFAALVAAGLAIGHTSAMLMVWFAPKVWLLKELAGLLR